ncbi:MAG TPA: hypothetical protein VFI87_10100 [Hyphomicrobiaceae bacterium]|nr:hypothetical protein [Hyphomicrobiaceae bacterium]
MNVTHLTQELRRGLDAVAIPTAEQQDRLEVRLLTLYITYEFINGLIGPITFIYGLEPSLLHKVAALSHGSWLVGVMFIAALLLAVPHAVALLFFPKTLAVRWPRKLATAAAAIVALTWAYLSILAIPLDMGMQLFWVFLRQAFESMALAFLYAISLNAQLLRALNQALHSHEAQAGR